MFLADTTLVSETFKVRPDSGVSRWLESTAPALVYFSVLTLGEVLLGAVHRQSHPASRLVKAWVDDAGEAFSDHVLPVTIAIAERWGEIAGEALRRGSPLPAIDSLIAATAIVHDLTVVTRNVADFERCGAKVLSPWSGAR